MYIFRERERETFVYTYVYIYIYVYDRCMCISLSLSLSSYIYIYIHTHVNTPYHGLTLWRTSCQARPRRVCHMALRGGTSCLHFSICACHPCAGAMLIFSVSYRELVIMWRLHGLPLSAAPSATLRQAISAISSARPTLRLWQSVTACCMPDAKHYHI